MLSAWFAEGAAAATGRLALQAAMVRSSVDGLVREVVRRARARSELRDGVDVRVVADAVVRMILSLLTLPASSVGRRSAGSVERRLVEQILVGSILVSAR